MAMLSQPMSQARRVLATQTSWRVENWRMEGRGPSRILPQVASKSRIIARESMVQHSRTCTVIVQGEGGTKQEAGCQENTGEVRNKIMVHQEALSMPGNPIP